MDNQTYIISLRLSLRGTRAKDVRSKIKTALKDWKAADIADTDSTWFVATQDIVGTLERLESSLSAIRNNLSGEARLSQYLLNIQLLDKETTAGFVLPLVDANRPMVQSYLGMPEKQAFRLWPFGKRKIN